MASALPALAHRVRQDPFFLASALAIYAESEAMDDQQLAKQLGCTVDTLAPVRLCRRPRAEPPLFRQDVEMIAARFGLHADVLAAAVRRADAITALRREAEGGQGALIAARDRRDDQPPIASDEPEQP
jgi:hypothetical protein